MDRGRRASYLSGQKNKGQSRELVDIMKDDALQFLPAKSLLRFKGVCRDWHSQISVPFFAHKQSNKFREISGFFCQTGQNQPSFISLDPTAYGVPDPSLSFLPEPVDIRTSSNGLLCCQGREGDKAYYICNPVTKIWKKLPKSSCAHGSDSALVLVFEPSLLNFVAEYKLLCAFPSVELGDGYEFEVYDSKSGSWKLYGEIYLGNKKLFTMSGVHANDIVYWLATDCGTILAFDLTTERTKTLYGYGTLGVVNGRLCSTKYSRLGLSVHVLSNSHTNTMQMGSRVKAWEELQRVELTPTPPHGWTSWDYSVRNVLFAGGNSVLFLDANKLNLCDMKSKEIRCLRDCIDHDINVVGYVNSLVEI